MFTNVVFCRTSTSYTFAVQLFVFFVLFDVCAAGLMQVRMLFALAFLLCFSYMDMDTRSVVATGLDPEDAYQDVRSFFASIGAVEQLVRVIDANQKFTGKAYVVYTSPRDATAAALRLSKNDVTVQALGEDKTEFEALVDVRVGDQSQQAASFVNQWQKFSPQEQQMMMKMMGMAPEATVKTPSSAGSFFRGDSTVVVQDKPHLPSFSGSGKDCSFGRWKYDITCLDKDDKYSDSTVLEAVRKSLKTPAADVLRQLGIKPTLTQVLKKMESIYGSVLSGEAILERFYQEKQDKDESCAKWSMRLEDWVYQAVEKKVLPEQSIAGTLKQRFWSGLRDPTIRNALRHRYMDLDFEQVVSESRVIEEETTQKTEVKSHQVIESDSKLDILIKKMERFEVDLKELKDAQKKPTENKTKGPVICTVCNMEGHWYWGCKKGQDIECKRCGAKGHISKACRNKKTSLNK